MKIIDWNIRQRGNEAMCSYLASHLNGDAIAILQEVTPQSCEALRKAFPQTDIAYSLDLHPAGKFDGKARQLGVAIVATDGVSIVSSRVLERTPLPDRTLFVEATCNGVPFTALGLHSVTGVGYKHTKSVQFMRFAEAVDDLRPDIVGIDANEPEVDAEKVDGMTFWDNDDKGAGAQTFFTTANDKCHDAWAAAHAGAAELPVSHIVRGSQNRRYDFLFVNREWDCESCEYCYDEAIAAGSDHALVVAEVTPR